MSRLRAETMPAVTEPPRLNGLPMAMTHSPSRSFSESPNFTALSGLSGLDLLRGGDIDDCVDHLLGDVGDGVGPTRGGRTRERRQGHRCCNEHGQSRPADLPGELKKRAEHGRLSSWSREGRTVLPSISGRKGDLAAAN